MKKKQLPFIVKAIYDTETCNIDVEETRDLITLKHVHAYPVLYITNLLKDPVEEYETGKSDNIIFDRYGTDFLKHIDALIEEAEGNYIPIVCAYNLMFDLQPVLFEIRKKYEVTINAQSTRTAYTVDIMKDDKIVLRFWDTMHLEPRGLWAMGEAVGVEKAIGDWDYSLVRTPETPLTEKELFYAARDVQVIPAYLRYIVEANKFLEPSDLGCACLTKTSLVRLLSKRVIGAIQIPCKKGYKKLETLMFITCKNERPKSYEQYALRKSCFRGGLTFTAANYASEVQEDVLSIDAVSMHHAHINGMTMFQNFKKMLLTTEQRTLQVIAKKDLDQVLSNYECPFPFAIHAKVKIRGLRLKKDSVFERAGIATLAEAKFGDGGKYENFACERAEAATVAVKANGYKDLAIGTPEEPRVYAYSKLMSASECVVHVNEYEWWVLNQVYDYDSYEVLEAESSSKRYRAPEYVTLVSNMLYKQKDELKQILKTYEEGTSRTLNNSSLPGHIVKMIEEGSASVEYLESYYKNIIKGSYNAIYGSQAQDVYKPNFKVDENCTISVDEETIADPENFEDIKAGGLVLYTYGMRIVARSRMHLTIAIMLLDKAFGDRIKILGGDTDSLKIAAGDVTDDEIMQALKPLHEATKAAIFWSQKESREQHPDMCSELPKLGEYEIESYASGKYTRYKKHVELWNKCRISIGYDDKVHITCAGVSRPRGQYTLEDLAEDMIAKYGEDMISLILGYNTFFDSSISYLLAHSNPEHGQKIKATVTDYLGNTSEINLYESIGLEPASKTIGDGTKITNLENLYYKHQQGKKPDATPVDIWIDDKFSYILYGEGTEREKLYKVEKGYSKR